jgi:hypothetical protein
MPNLARGNQKRMLLAAAPVKARIEATPSAAEVAS